MKLSRYFVPLLFLLGTDALFAQSIIDPVTLSHGRGSRVEGTFTTSTIGYENNGPTSDFERKILGVGMNIGINSSVDFIGQFGLILDGKIENTNFDGDGFNLGFGLNGSVYNKGRVSMNALGLFVYQKETYKSDPLKIDYTNKELHLGGVANFQAAKNIGIHGGLMLVPMSDTEGKSGGASLSLERDDMIYLVLGATFAFDSVTIRPQVTLMGEESFTIGVSTRI